MRNKAWTGCGIISHLRVDFNKVLGPKFRREWGGGSMEEVNAENFSRNNERKTCKNSRNLEIEREHTGHSLVPSFYRSENWAQRN